MISTEHIISTIPCAIRRRVKSGECDPAGVVYTAAFSEYVISAAELFYGALFGTCRNVRRPSSALGRQRVRSSLSFAARCDLTTSST